MYKQADLLSTYLHILVKIMSVGKKYYHLQLNMLLY